MVNYPPVKQEVKVQSLGWEDTLEKEMATHSSILAWEIPRTEEPGELQSLGLQRIGLDLAAKPPLSTRLQAGHFLLVGHCPCHTPNSCKCAWATAPLRTAGWASLPRQLSSSVSQTGLLGVISMGLTPGPHLSAHLCPGTHPAPFPNQRLGLVVLLPGRSA